MAVLKWKVGDIEFIDEFDETKANEPEDINKDIAFEQSPDKHDVLNPDLNNDKKKPEEDRLPLDEELPSIGECIFGFHTMALVAETVRSTNYSFDNPIEIDIASAFQFVNAVKKLLVNMEQPQSKSVSNGENGELAKQAYNFIEECREHIFGRDEMDIDVVQNEYPLVFDSQNDTRAVAIKIVERVALASADSKIAQPYKLYEKLAVLVSSDITTERRNIIRQISFAKMYKPDSSKPLSCQLVLDDKQYIDYVSKNKTEIINKCNEIGSQYLNTNSISNPTFANAVDSMRKLIHTPPANNGSNNDGKSTKMPFYEYIDKTRCFGVFFNGSEKYISMSGKYDAIEPMIINYYNLNGSLKKWKKLKKLIDSYINADSILIGAEYAEINLDVKTNLPPPEKLADAIRNNRVEPQDEPEFTCCERKMISKTQPSSSERAFMFTRHIPCDNCGTSISFFSKSALEMKVYYLNDDKDHPEDKEIKTYTIT